MHSGAEGCRDSPGGWGTSSLPSVPASEGSACRELSTKGQAVGPGSEAKKGPSPMEVSVAVSCYVKTLPIGSGQSTPTCCSRETKTPVSHRTLEVGVRSSLGAIAPNRRRPRIPHRPWAACPRGSPSSGQGWCWRTDRGSHRHGTEQGRGLGRLALPGSERPARRWGPLGRVTQRPAHEDCRPDSTQIVPS